MNLYRAVRYLVFAMLGFVVWAVSAYVYEYLYSRYGVLPMKRVK